MGAASTEQPAASPRMRALQEALAASQTQALEAFWQDAIASGTPLIEPCADGNGEHVLVTFLWRTPAPVANVVLVGGPASGEAVRDQLVQLLHTNVWYKTCRMPAEARFTYRLVPNYPLTDATFGLDRAAFGAWFSALPLDPLNRFPLAPYGSAVELPAAAPQPFISPQLGVPHGTEEPLPFRSEVLSSERTIWVYTPPGYNPASPDYGLLVTFDGTWFSGWSPTWPTVPTLTILDNLLIAGTIPPLVGLFVDTAASRYEELACSRLFLGMLTEELLPWLHQQYHVTAEPERTIVAGASLGGLAAAFVAHQRPDVFGNVLSLSGDFRWPHPYREDEEPEWLARQVASSARVPVRFYLEAGALERSGAAPSLVVANRHLRDVLEARGYVVDYVEVAGGHDPLSWRGGMAHGLVALTTRP